MNPATHELISNALKDKWKLDAIIATMTYNGHSPSQATAKELIAEVEAEQPAVAQTSVAVELRQNSAEASVEQAATQSAVESVQQAAEGATERSEGERSERADNAIATPFDGALHVASKGVPQFPLAPRTKVPVDASMSKWQDLATTDPAQLNAWAAQYPDANWAGVALSQPGGIWILDIDNAEAVKALGLPKLPKTFQVRSSPGKGHTYFRHNALSLDLAKDKASYSIKDSGGKEIASARLNHAYCVTAKSTHPDGHSYEIVSDVDLVEAPQELIEWIRDHAMQDKKLPVTASSDGPHVARGSHDNELIRIAGKLRAVGLEFEDMVPILVRNVEERFDDVDPGENIQTWCEAKAQSACKYPKSDGSIPLTPAMQARHDASQQATAAVAVATAPIEIPEFTKVSYPMFPRWIMEVPGESGIAPSIYTGLVKPWCDVNSRYPEFMFLPAMALLLNYLNKKVHIAYNDTPFSIFMMLIGKQGRVIKSSSVESAIRYLADAGVCDYASSVNQADLKTLVWTAGSTEGLGMGMRDKRCVNAVLFYDEFKTAASKAKIDAASLGSVLLTMYESGLFQNQIKSVKSSFSFPPKSYVTSFIACNTDEDFGENWASLATGKKGMDERFFFLLQPEHLDPLKPKHDVDCSLAALETKKLIDKAILQGKFTFADTRRWDAKIEEFGNRASLRAAKWALAFAVDMGLDVIDEDCLERGYALSQYELDVKRYLGAHEAETKEAMIQNRVRETLSRQLGGHMMKKALEKLIKPERFGTTVWYHAYNGLIQNKIICEQGTGTKSDPVIVQLLQAFSEEA